MKLDSPLSPEPKRKPTARDRDGLFKKRGVWQYRLKIDGRWKQYSTRTKSFAEAKKARSEAIQQLEEGRLPTDEAKLLIKQALPQWLAERRSLKAKTTWQTETFLSKPIIEELGAKRLSEITAADLRRYQTSRVAQVSPGTVNRELRILRAVLKQNRLWRRIEDDYVQLRERKRGIGRALTVEEQQRLFSVAASKPEWRVAFLAGILAVNTTARGCELKALLVADVDLANSEVHIRRSKTEAGHRTIPMNESAKWAAARLLQRAESLGATDARHYLLPAIQPGKPIDPVRPQKTWRAAWRSLTKAAGFHGLRFHDLRHCAVTALAESGASDSTIMAISGHLDRAMMEHYSHTRAKAKRDAVESIQSFVPTESHHPEVGGTIQ